MDHSAARVKSFSIAQRTYLLCIGIGIFHYSEAFWASFAGLLHTSISCAFFRLLSASDKKTRSYLVRVKLARSMSHSLYIVFDDRHYYTFASIPLSATVSPASA